MTIATDLVTRAYRELNLIPTGDSPTTAEATEGLTLLNNLVDFCIGTLIGENLAEWPVPPPQRTDPTRAQYPLFPPESDVSLTVYQAPPGNVRLMCSITTATTLYMPHNPNDGARVSLANVGMTATLTLDGNGRKIETASTLAVTNSATTKRWFYRGDTGNWVLLATLAGSDTPPLPIEYDDYLAIGTAIRLGPRHGRTVSAESLAMYKMQQAAIKARYRQITASINPGDIVNSMQTPMLGTAAWMT